VAGRPRKYSPEFKEEAAKMVVEASQTIVHVAKELGVNESSLGNWVREYRNTTDFRFFGCPGMLPLLCSVCDLVSVSGMSEDMVSARVSRRGSARFHGPRVPG
jgi:transposase-like protein